MNKPFLLICLFLLINCTFLIASPVHFSFRSAGNIPLTIKRITADHDSIVIVPFEYKQSALFHAFTLRVMDSVILLLLKDSSIKLSIEGYTHSDEGSESILYYLSLNRALFVKDYVIGRGVDSNRILSVKGLSNLKPLLHGVNNEGIIRNCRAEILLHYPPPPVIPFFSDKDEDGIPDNADSCPDVFGKKELNGCPDKETMIIPFESQQTSLNPLSYRALDSVIQILKQNPSFTITITGHAYKTEGNKSLCKYLSKERASIVKDYLNSRYIFLSRINALNNYGDESPINAGKNPAEILRNSRTEIHIIRH